MSCGLSPHHFRKAAVDHCYWLVLTGRELGLTAEAAKEEKGKHRLICLLIFVKKINKQIINGFFGTKNVRKVNTVSHKNILLTNDMLTVRPFYIVGVLFLMCVHVPDCVSSDCMIQTSSTPKANTCFTGILCVFMCYVFKCVCFVYCSECRVSCMYIYIYIYLSSS